MADIASSIELRDPLGPTPNVDRAGYLDALARLGYNVENMNSPLPFVTANMNAASSLITNAYKQNLDFQKAQADAQYYLASAKHIDSETAYNEATLDTRIKGLEADTLKKQTEAEVAKSTMGDTITMSKLLLESQKQKNAYAEKTDPLHEDILRIQDETAKTGYAQYQQAITEANAAKQKWTEQFPLFPRGLNNPNYKAESEKWLTDNGDLVFNPATRDEVAKWKAVQDGIYQAQSASQINEAMNAEFIQNQKEHLTPLYLNPDTMSQQAKHDWIIKSNLQRTDDKLKAAINALPETGGTPALAKLREQLIGYDVQIQAYNKNDNERADIADGKNINVDPNGRERSDIARALQQVDTYLKMAGIQTPPEIEITEPSKPGAQPLVKMKGRPEQLLQYGYLDPTGKIYTGPGAKPPAAPALSQEEQSYRNAAAAAAIAQAPDNSAVRDIAEAYRKGQLTDSGFRDQLARFFAPGTTPQAKQTGGIIFDPASVGAGLPKSTDTVPAMLTPGEYVVNRNAVQAVGQGTLDAINQAGQVSSTPRLGSISSSPLGPTGLSIAGRKTQPTAASTGQPEQQTAAAKPTSFWQGPTSWYQQPSTSSTAPAGSTTPATAPATTQAAATTVPQTLGTFTNPATGSVESLGTGWVKGIGTEFGEVDNPVYGGYTEPNWDKGAGGAKLSGWDTEGVALPNVPLGTVVEVMNPKTGKTTTTRVIDHGPGPGTGAAIDLAGGTRAALGFERNFKGPIQYRIVSLPGAKTADMQEGGPVNNPFASLPQRLQRGGVVSEEGSIGTRGERGAFGGGRTSGIEAQLDRPVDPQMRHRRFHPRVGAAGSLGGLGPDIPDPMQKKLSKLSQDYLSGLSDLIRQRPEMGPALLHHARRQLAANMGGQPDETGAEIPGQQRGIGIPPEAYTGGMSAYGGGGGEESGTQYLQTGGAVTGFPEDLMSAVMLDPESMGINFQQGGTVPAGLPYSDRTSALAFPNA